MRMMSALWWAVVAPVLAACGSSSNAGAPPAPTDGGADASGTPSCPAVGAFTGIVSCPDAMDGGVGPDMCVLSMPVTGGLSATLCEGTGVTICGTGALYTDAGSLPTMDWSVRSTGTAIDTDVTIDFDATIAVDQTETLPAAIDIRQTFDGACSISIAGSVCLPRLGDRVLSGSGSCTSPATPLKGTAAQPITIGAFTFNGYIHP